jgi:serine/threonine protein kinase
MVTRIDRYLVGERIGMGGFAEVFSARHEFTDALVALKVLRLERVGDVEAVARARAEAMALARIRHANLVPVLDAGITKEGVVWMAMPLLDGITLRELLRRRGPLPVSQALRVAIDVCDGVAAAHELGVWHRDLKPENVFFTRGEEVVVLDLGLAKLHAFGVASTPTGALRGTPRYLAPEQILGHAVDARCDVYAIGLVLLELLCGELAFARDAAGKSRPTVELLYSRAHRDSPKLDGLVDDVALASLLARALALRPADRPAGASALARELRILARREGAVAPAREQRYVPPTEAPQFFSVLPEPASVRVGNQPPAPSSPRESTRPHEPATAAQSTAAPKAHAEAVALIPLAGRRPLAVGAAAPPLHHGRAEAGWGVALGLFAAGLVQLLWHGLAWP